MLGTCGFSSESPTSFAILGAIWLPAHGEPTSRSRSQVESRKIYISKYPPHLYSNALDFWKKSFKMFQIFVGPVRMLKLEVFEVIETYSPWLLMIVVDCGLWPKQCRFYHWHVLHRSWAQQLAQNWYQNNSTWWSCSQNPLSAYDPPSCKRTTLEIIISWSPFVDFTHTVGSKMLCRTSSTIQHITPSPPLHSLPKRTRLPSS